MKKSKKCVKKVMAEVSVFSSLCSYHTGIYTGTRSLCRFVTHVFNILCL
jgi:hypothetical protein